MRCAQFKKISQLEEVAPNQMVDVIGVVDRVDAQTTIQRRDGSEACSPGPAPSPWQSSLPPGSGLRQACSSSVGMASPAA